MSGLPEGTATFLMTDVEGSTAAWEHDPVSTGAAIRELDELVGRSVGIAGGVVVKARGEGDSHFCVFARAGDAASAGLALLEALENFALPVRMAIHTGEAELRDGDYFGRTVNRAARLRSAGHGGQLLLSDVTAGLVRQSLPDGATLRDLGVHRLKDLSSPESIWQLVHPSATVVTKPLRTLDVLRNNLPLQLTDLIGRHREVTEVLSLMSGSRLVTLVGLGGSGKTRLGLQASAEASGSHSGGVWLTELAPLGTAAEVGPAILGAVGGPAGIDPLAEAANWIGEREVLLLLDNCEHLIDACAFAVGHLLTRCANLRVLATSRQPLEVAGEMVFRIPPLGLPDDVDNVAGLAAAPAVRLFRERGRQVSPGFEITAANAEAVAALCDGLDGMPLAIELAAARLKVLDPEQILARLGDRLALVDGTRSADGGRTVRAAIEWSHDLLKPEERALLRRMGIFEASASLEAIEAVCADWPGDPADSLANLVDHSLVVVDTAATGRRRYRLLDLVRAYSLERLDEAEERETMEQARVRWMDDSIAGFGWARALELRDEFHAARPDFVAALEWTEVHEPEAFAGRVAAAVEVWGRFQWINIADRWARKVLEVDGLDSSIRERLLGVASECAFNTSAFERALRYSEEQLSIAAASGDAIAVETANNSVAASAMYLEQFDRARAHYTAALDSALSRQGGRSAAVLYAQNLGLLSSLSGDRAGAVAWFERCAELGEEVGGTAMGLWRLGEQAQHAGETREAEALYKRALSAAQVEEDRQGQSHAYESLGLLAEAEGRWADAAANHRASREVALEPGYAAAAGSLLALSRVAHAEGKPAEARELIGRALGELAGEPAQQVQALAMATRRSQRMNHPEAARDLARALLEVAQRDASSADVALALVLSAECEETLGNLEEARALAISARPKLAALGDAQILRWKAADLAARCDAMLTPPSAAERPPQP